MWPSGWLVRHGRFYEDFAIAAGCLPQDACSVHHEFTIGVGTEDSKPMSGRHIANAEATLGYRVEAQRCPGLAAQWVDPREESFNLNWGLDAYRNIEL